MKRPWLKFYPADWQADQALGSCSLAARGLWMEMLAIMHRAEPYGHLVLNGKPPTDTQLACLARCPLDQIPTLVDELESAGVFSRARNRVIYSRRMTTDEKRRKDGELSKKTEGKIPGSRRSQALEKQGQKSATSQVEGKVIERPPNHPEARSQNPPKSSLPENPFRRTWNEVASIARQRGHSADADAILKAAMKANIPEAERLAQRYLDRQRAA